MIPIGNGKCLRCGGARYTSDCPEVFGDAAVGHNAAVLGSHADINNSLTDAVDALAKAAQPNGDQGVIKRELDQVEITTLPTHNNSRLWKTASAIAVSNTALDYDKASSWFLEIEEKTFE